MIFCELLSLNRRHIGLIGLLFLPVKIHRRTKPERSRLRLSASLRHNLAADAESRIGESVTSRHSG